MIKKFQEIINWGIRQSINDIHIAGGQPLVYRKDGILLSDRSNVWHPKDIDTLVESLLSEKQLFNLRKRWSVDFALSVNRVRIRINVFYTTRGLSMAIRLLPEVIPDIRLLNLHPSLVQIAELKSGLILVCGSTGSGKSTTIAAILEEVNRNRALHIITLEDPIEYRFRSKKSFIEQREVGIHVPSFKQGLLDVLRENPDVIVVGELREPETIRLALNAAESGHLVFASLHASDAEDAIFRINNAASGESDEIIRFQFASTLQWLIVQQLYFIERLGFRVPALSILRGTTSVRSIIRENRLSQIESTIFTSRNEGMFTMDRYINEFINAQKNFTHPNRIFQMAEDQPEEPVFQSSLIDPNAVQDVVYMSTVQEEMAGARKTRPVEDYDQQYSIDEDADLKSLIAEMEKRMPSAAGGRGVSKPLPPRGAPVKKP